jgi:hypothetical protein
MRPFWWQNAQDIRQKYIMNLSHLQFLRPLFFNFFCESCSAFSLALLAEYRPLMPWYSSAKWSIRQLNNQHRGEIGMAKRQKEFIAIFRYTGIVMVYRPVRNSECAVELWTARNCWSAIWAHPVRKHAFKWLRWSSTWNRKRLGALTGSHPGWSGTRCRDLCPSDEALIKISYPADALARLGYADACCMPRDMFGHVSQMPQIYNDLD